MTKCTTHMLFLSFLSLDFFLFSFLSFDLSETSAEGTNTSSIEIRETRQSTETLSDTKEKHTYDREEGDDRDDLPAYALLNLSIIAKEFFKTMEIQGTVFNLLDKDYSDPGPISVPDDIPRPGRTFFVGLSYQF